jgi:hypothetical protein
MKNRIGFVSNSSSSSFIINIYDLTSEQLFKMIAHTKSDIKDRWDINVKNGLVSGFTVIDNFDMYEFLVKELKIPSDKIEWDSD